MTEQLFNLINTYLKGGLVAFVIPTAFFNTYIKMSRPVFSSKGNKSYLELYVQGFIRTTNRITLSKKDVQRAIALISNKISNPCCDDSSSVTDLYTIRKGNFLVTFEQLLKMLPLKGNLLTLQRTKKMLEDNIGTYCCPTDQGTFTTPS